MLDKIAKDLKELRRESNSDSANKGIEAHKSIKVNTKGKVLCDEMTCPPKVVPIVMLQIGIIG